MIQRLTEASRGPELRIGALFAGAGGLDLAVQAVLGGSLAWVSEIDPAASKVLAHHYPDVPNHGDITRIDWSLVESVDILTGGFPCQDLSVAGLQAGLRSGTRSGLWSYYLAAIKALRPGLVVIENVGGLLTSRGAPPTDDLLAAWERRDRCAAALEYLDRAEERAHRAQNWTRIHRVRALRRRLLGRRSRAVAAARRADALIVRAIGTVLGDLASIRFDAEWTCIRASDVGGCHGRLRVAVLAWPAGADPPGFGCWPARGDDRIRIAGLEPESPADAHRDAVRIEPVALAGGSGQALVGLAGGERRSAADSDGPGREGPGSTSRSGAGGRTGEDSRGSVAGRRRAAADTPCDGRDEGRPEPARIIGRPDAAQCGAGAAAHPDGVRPLRGGPARGRWRASEDDDRAAATDPDSLGLGADERDLRQGQPDAAGCAAGDAQGVGEPDEQRCGAEHVVQPVAGAEHRDRERHPAAGVRQLGRAAPVLAWGPYEFAIRRWELILGRAAPAPTEPATKGGQRLSPRFVEWMQGFEDGWVTAVPGVSRNDQLRILGNAVVQQQFTEAIRFLLDRAFGLEAAA